MHKLRYLQVNCRVPKKSFHKSAQNKGVNNTVSSPGSLQAREGFLKKAERCIMSSLLCESPDVKFIWRFLAGYTSSHDRYDVNFNTGRTTKLLIPIIKSFVILKVLIQNERTQWFTVRPLRSAFVQGIVRVGYSPFLLLHVMNSCK